MYGRRGCGRSGTIGNCVRERVVTDEAYCGNVVEPATFTPVELGRMTRAVHCRYLQDVAVGVRVICQYARTGHLQAVPIGRAVPGHAKFLVLGLRRIVIGGVVDPGIGDAYMGRAAPKSETAATDPDLQNSARLPRDASVDRHDCNRSELRRA